MEREITEEQTNLVPSECKIERVFRKAVMWTGGYPHILNDKVICSRNPGHCPSPNICPMAKLPSKISVKIK